MMQRQQCNVQQFNYDKQSLFLGQLRLVPKIGQWGQLEFEGFRLHKIYKEYNDYNYFTIRYKSTFRYKMSR
jgi:hypothetical protein